MILFGTVAAGGIKIIASTGNVDGRDLLILAVSVGLGMGVQMVRDALQELPDGLRSVFGSPIVTGGLTALLLNAVLRDEETRPASP